MRFNVDDLQQIELYKLLTSTVTPRPIAWVTSCTNDLHKENEDNISQNVNAAPFSFFNVMGTEPPLAVFSVGRSLKQGKKDTISNILQNGEFVVNLVSEELGDAMNLTAMDAPHGFDELAAIGLETAPSVKIKTPRIAKSPVAFECINHATMLTGKNQYMVIGKIVEIYIADEFMIDVEKFYVDTEKLNLLGRMHGGQNYTRCHDLVKLKRLSFEEFKNL